MKIHKVIEHFRQLSDEEVEFLMHALETLEAKLPGDLFKEMYLEELRVFVEISRRDN